MTNLIHAPKGIRNALFPRPWRFAIVSVAITSMQVGLALVSHAQGEEQNATPAVIRKVLIEARDAYVKDEVGTKVNPRVLRYIYMREGINHSPLFHIAAELAECDEAEAVATAELIKSSPWRAFTLIHVSLAHAEHGRNKSAKKTLAKAIEIFNEGDFPKGAKEQLWPKVAGVLLQIHGDLDATKAACAKLGCPWDTLDKEELQFELAKFHVSRGKIEKARQALGKLPPDTFTKRKGIQSLQNDSGAGLYFWAQQPDSAYTAEHVLLEWLQSSGKTELIEKFIQKLPNDDINKLNCYLNLAKQYHHAGNIEQSAKALKQVVLLKESYKDKTIREAIETDLMLARLEIEGKIAARASRESDILKKNQDKPWINILIRALLEAGELEYVESFIKDRKLDGHTQSILAVAMAKAGRFEDALAQAKQVDKPLVEPMILLSVAQQKIEDGDSDGAKHIWLDAVKKADKVPSTNMWFPPEGQVRHQMKWQMMSRLLASGVQMGFAKESLEQFSGDNASIRVLAQALGSGDKDVQIRQWIKSFDESARNEGARCYALLGLAESMARRKP